MIFKKIVPVTIAHVMTKSNNFKHTFQSKFHHALHESNNKNKRTRPSMRWCLDGGAISEKMLIPLGKKPHG